MKETCLLYFTNTLYNDIWLSGLNNLKKYGPKFSNVYALVDNEFINDEFGLDILIKLYPFTKIFVYENSWTYSKRILKVLDNIKDNYVLMFHDNNLITNKVSDKYMDSCEKFIIDNNVHQFRMSNAGLFQIDNSISLIDTVDIVRFKLSEPNQYSLMPTIWARDIWSRLFKSIPDLTYANIECEFIHNIIRLNFNSYCINYNNCKNIIFPVTHFVSRGKWQYHCIYDVIEINKILIAYNIDINKRGILWGIPEEGKLVET